VPSQKSQRKIVPFSQRDGTGIISHGVNVPFTMKPLFNSHKQQSMAAGFHSVTLFFSSYNLVQRIVNLGPNLTKT